MNCSPNSSICNGYQNSKKKTFQFEGLKHNVNANRREMMKKKKTAVEGLKRRRGRPKQLAAEFEMLSPG